MLNLSTNENILIYGTSNARDSVLFTNSSDNFPHTSLFNNNYNVDAEVLIKDIVKNTRLSLKDDFSSESLKVQTTIIRSLDSENIKLKRHLCINIKKSDDEYIVELPQIELYAYSDDINSAIEELKEEIIDLCDVIFTEEDYNLSNKVKKWKRYLEQFLTYANE